MTDPSGPSGPSGPADLGHLLTQVLGKTDAGRREISARALALSRSARNLLLIIDANRNAGQWLALVRGSGPAELQQLLDAGLVGVVGVVGMVPAAGSAANPATPVVAPAPVVTPPPVASSGLPGPADTARAPARMGLADALQTLGYQVLYDRLTAAARQQLGLIKGYKLILDIEKCAGPPELRSLALQFVEQVRAAKGDAEARALAQRLVDPG